MAIYDETRRVWIKNIKTGLEMILPITPFFKFKHSVSVNTTDLMGCGEIENGRTIKLDTFECDECFFPYYKNGGITRVDYVKYEAWYYVEVFTEWFKSGDILHFTYYSQYKTINDYYCKMTDFQHYEKSGNKNIYYTMAFIEWKEEKLYSATMDIDAERIIKEYGSPYYYVGDGDTLISIAQKLYGDSSKWDYLMNNNNLKNPLDLTIGQKLKI